MAICPLCRTKVKNRYTVTCKSMREGKMVVRCDCGMTRSFRGEVCTQQSLFDEMGKKTSA